MGKRRKFGCKNKNKRRIRSKVKASDESDEDFVLGEHEKSDNSEEFCDSSNGDESEEILDFGTLTGSSEKEEEEMRKIVKPKPQKRSSGRRKTGVKQSRKRIRVSDDDDYYDDDDMEFTLEEEELQPRKKSKVTKRLPRKKGSAKTRKRKRKSEVLKKPLRKKQRKSSILGRPESSEKKARKGKKSSVFNSDSGSSDFEYTISEEEREQIREASRLCGNMVIGLRSSALSKKLQVDEAQNRHQRKPQRRRGKEKLEDLQKDSGKQMCGICLSEEGKGTIRGTLNCCSHYFCFACIMEWSKVETRCPLCKQRFLTISKPARSNIGIDLRNVAFRVPMRDQVYRPSEEEIRGYLDPYENLVCMECQQGVDDNLMLLCDVCDSPAHTYCVGLGREVPEGNWYCEGCRPSDPGSSNSLFQDPPLLQGTSSRNLPHEISIRQYSESVLDQPSSQGVENVPSPRYIVGEDTQAPSLVPGAAASTLLGRRRLHRQIYNLLSNSNNRMSQAVGRTDRISHTSFESDVVNSEVEQGAETTRHPTRPLESGGSGSTVVEGRPHDHPKRALESGGSGSTVVEGRPHDRSFCPVQDRGPISERLTHLGRQVIQDPITVTANGSPHGTSCDELARISLISGNEQLPQCSSRPSIGSDASDSLHGSSFYIVKEQLQTMVRRHLKCLSQNRDLGRSTFKDIARTSTHSILAACGLEHRMSLAYPVQPPSNCPHLESVGGSMSLIVSCCSACFDSFVKDTVVRVMNMRLYRNQ